MHIRSLTLTDHRIFRGENTIAFNDGMTMIQGEGGAGKTTLCTALRNELLGPGGSSRWPSWRRKAELRHGNKNRYPVDDGEVVVEADWEGTSESRVPRCVFLDAGVLEDILGDPSLLIAGLEGDLEGLNARFADYYQRIADVHRRPSMVIPSVVSSNGGMMVSLATTEGEARASDRRVPFGVKAAVAFSLALAARDVLTSEAPLVVDGCLMELERAERVAVIEVMQKVGGQVIMVDDFRDMERRPPVDYALALDHDSNRSRVRKVE